MRKPGAEARLEAQERRSFGLGSRKGVVRRKRRREGRFGVGVGVGVGAGADADTAAQGQRIDTPYALSGAERNNHPHLGPAARIHSAAADDAYAPLQASHKHDSASAAFAAADTAPASHSKSRYSALIPHA